MFWSYITLLVVRPFTSSSSFSQRSRCITVQCHNYYILLVTHIPHVWKEILVVLLLVMKAGGDISAALPLEKIAAKRSGV